METTPFKISWPLKNAREALDSMEAEMKRLLEIANTHTGKIAEVKLCGQMAVYGMSAYEHSSTGFYGYSLPPEAVVAKATEALEKEFARVKAIHEANIPAIENNKAVCASVSTMMRNIGIPDSFSTWEYPSSRSRTKKEIKHVAGWMLDLRRVCICDDGFSYCENQYKVQRETISCYAEKKKAEKENAEKAKKAEEAEKLSVIELARFQLKYGLESSSTWEDVLEKILSMDKYLRLAHFLELNRNDWNDGCSYAETGIKGFAEENETDKLIVENIVSYFSDFEDGRVFRDCTYNYNVLRTDFVKDKDLLADYSAVFAKV